MIRFLIICSVILLLYLSLSVVGEFDARVSFNVYDYIVESTLFTFITGFVLSLFAILIVLKVIFLIFEFPYLIKKRMHLRKNHRANHALVQSMVHLLANNKFKAAEISKKVERDLSVEHKDLYNLILAESEEDFDKKIDYYRLLFASKDYTYFAAKRLASIFARNGFYEQAEDYASKAFNINEFDSDVLVTLLYCYGNQKLWNKFVFIISKLARVDPKKLNEMSIVTSNYYVQAAKDTLEKGEDHQAMNYVESALELNPSNTEAVDFFLSLNLSLNRGQDNLKVLQNALSINPSFEIAEIFINASNEEPEQIYNKLANLIEPEKNRSLFLAVAAILNLPHKIELLNRSTKLLTHYN